jgi:hypothetical protein
MKFRWCGVSVLGFWLVACGSQSDFTISSINSEGGNPPTGSSGSSTGTKGFSGGQAGKSGQGGSNLAGSGGKAGFSGSGGNGGSGFGGNSNGGGSGGPAASCQPQDVNPVGSCEPGPKYYWDGKKCSDFVACSCEGSDCDSLYSTKEVCLKEHVQCSVSVDPCAGKSCGESCSTCETGGECPDSEQFCDSSGQCSGNDPQCGGSECKTEKDCPLPTVCTFCWDGSCSAIDVVCHTGFCLYQDVGCPPQPTCNSMEATWTGPCDTFFGFIWNGKSCEQVSGCQCVGKDCEKTFGSLEECYGYYSFCGAAIACEGKACGDPCSYCPEGQPCQGEPGNCNAEGVCASFVPECFNAPLPVSSMRKVFYVSDFKR